MFWSGNFIVLKELNFLLQDKNVTLTQVLEADDILQECKADNKALMCFLTKPEILAELITLVLEEPPKDAELSTQYRHANIASEVLTSELSMLSNHLSMDVAQMNRICDFVKKDPPLNPLLASYFSKTIGMLLEQSHKQDWCLYHIVCLRVLDFFRARRDFLPNLLRHMSTSAIADTFKYFIRLDFPFNKIIMEWFEEHQFLESLIQIICGTYEPPEIHYNPVVAIAQEEPQVPAGPEVKPEQNQAAQPQEPEKVQEEYVEKLDNQSEIEKQNRIDNRPSNVAEPENLDSANGNDVPEAEPGALQRCNEEREAAQRAAAGAGAQAAAGAAGGEAAAAGAEDEATAARRRAERAARLRAVAADNAASLLCDLLANAAGLACDLGSSRSADPWYTSKRKARALASRLRSERSVRALLAGMFTAPRAARTAALVAGTRLLTALLTHDLAPDAAAEDPEPTELSSVERAIAPHIPLLHHALLRDPALDDTPHDTPPPPPPHQPHNTAPNPDSQPMVNSSNYNSNGEATDSQATGSSSNTHVQMPNTGSGGSGESGGSGGSGEGGGNREKEKDKWRGKRVGAARLGAATLLAQLACSEVEDVPNALISLGTCGVVAALAWAHPHNNFLHAQLHALVRNALANRAHHHRYAHHFIEECNLLTQLMELFKENEEKPSGQARAGYMGHVVQMLRRFDELPDSAHPALAAAAWHEFRHLSLRPLLRRHDKPLCGFFPSEESYEEENMADEERDAYDIADAGVPDGDGDGDGEGERDGEGDGEGEGERGWEWAAGSSADFEHDEVHKMGPAMDFLKKSVRQFFELSKQRFDDGDDSPSAAPLQLGDSSPWESVASGEGGEGGEGGSGAEGACGGECWANFPDAFDQQPFWPYDAQPEGSQQGEAGMSAGCAGSAEGEMGQLGVMGEMGELGGVEEGMERVSLRGGEQLAQRLRNAMSSMAPDLVANIVNANLAPSPPSPPPPPPPPPPAPAPADDAQR